MRRTTKITSTLTVAGAAALAMMVATVGKSDTPKVNLPMGAAKLMSAGPMAFGPDGILFVGDSIGASIVAIDTQDTKANNNVKVNVEGIDAKIAAIAGITPDQIVINNVKVNPVSKNVYVSASRGKGPDAAALIAKVDTAGNVSLLALDNIRNQSVSLVDAPESNTSGRQNPRMQTITDMNYVNGNLMVAGLSNEEWNSALRSIPFPFRNADKGATLQIWHSSHGRFETQAPIRTFVPYSISGKQYVLAAYTCTPLVKIPVSELKPGAQIKGAEIADLGAGNQPIDMVPYKKDGHDYILIANSSFGVVKLKADNLEKYREIASPETTDVAGVPYDKIPSFTNVKHLAPMDAADVLVMSGKAGAISLNTVALP